MTAIRRRDARDIWQGLWEPYLLEYTGENPCLPEWTASGSLTKIRTGVRHQLTHRTLHSDFYLFQSDTRPSLPDAFRWIPESDLDRYAKPRLFEILLAELNKQNSPAI